MDGIQNIRNAIAKAVDAGVHFNAADLTESIAKTLGLNQTMINFTHVEIRNTVFEPEFKKIAVSNRIIFLPHCARNSKNCKATQTDDGYVCKHCGACNINEAIKIAKKHGYQKIFIVPGGSMLKKIIEKEKPKAAIGVSCFNEALMGIEAAKQLGVIPQAVLLLRDGCKDTMINLPLFEEKISLGLEEKETSKKEKTKKEKN
jgi:hypothetical protein